jgi:hypothetical protein
MINRFPPRSQPECCATCDQWYAKRRKGLPWCPVLKQLLPDDLTACGCAQWRKEPRESFAVALYQELKQELGQ